MEIKQVSVFVENKAGRLVAIFEALERRGISIHGLAVSDAAEIGIIRMILTNAEEGIEELRQAGFTTRMDQVVSTEIPDVPGGLLHSVVKPLADAGINLDYLYAYTEPSTGKTVAVIKTDDLVRAESVLESR
ncbi:ACT domain-containing protein [Chloroflexota bacterium]